MCMLHLDVCLIMRPLHVHLGGEYPLQEIISTGLCSPRRRTPFSVQVRCRRLTNIRECTYEESRLLALILYNMY